MRRLLWTLGPLLAVLVVTGTASVVTVAGASSVAGAVSLSPLTTDAVPFPASTAVHDLPVTVPVALTVTLANPHSAELAEFLAGVETPGSPEYRHFVTYDQYVERFAPPESLAKSVEATLVSAGAREVASTPDRAAVTAVLAAGSVERMFGVRLVSYGSVGGLPLYTAVGAPQLPASLVGKVAGLGGLSDANTAALDDEAARSAGSLHPEALGPGTFVRDNGSNEDWFVGSDYTQAFGATDLFPGNHSVPGATYPRSVAIATLLVSGYNDTLNQDLPPWDPAVVDAYFNGTLGPGWPMSNLTGVPVTVGGITPPMPGSYGALNDTSSYETENSLDLEMTGTLAPGAALYNFYFAASAITGSTTAGDAADYFAMDLARALDYSYPVPDHLAAVSCSFGIPDLHDSLWDTELLTAAATGVTVVASSGDQGNAPDRQTGRSDGQWPVWPASDATDLAGALSAGGVSLSLSGQPNAFFNDSPLNISYDPDAGSISNLSAWYDTGSGTGLVAGSEGGASTVYPEPYWQFHSAAQPDIVNATVQQGASMLGRSGPDVAMPGNMTLATVFANASGTIFFEILEGTSIAAPVLAGVIADVVAVDTNRSSGTWSPLGFVDPGLYSIASYFAAYPSTSSDPFTDVTNGSNYVFSATAGWDATTGWGTVDVPALLAAVNDPTFLDYNYTGPTPVLPILPPSPTGNIPWVVIFAIFGVGIVVAVVLVLYEARPFRPKNPSAGVPWGAQGVSGPLPSAPPGTYPGATYLCPYCGAIRPSEPVRCPQCRAL